MNWIKQAAFYLLCFFTAVASPFVLFLLFDVVYTNFLSPMPPREGPRINKDRGWYEFKNNSRGKYQWGDQFHDIQTDEFGFRTNPSLIKKGKADIVFLGDSFTFGINGNWDDTFVGMFDNSTKLKVLNTGIPGTSPTAYLYQYQKALNSNSLKRGHKVIMALDISDVADESRGWTDGPQHPVRRSLSNETTVIRSAKNFIHNNCLLTCKIYYFLRLGREKLNIPFQFDMPCSEFTWENWAKLDVDHLTVDGKMDDGFLPLGVQGGLDRIKMKAAQISALARENNASLFILIYPWPGQIKYPQKFSWAGFAERLCREVGCDGVIDAQPAFLKLAKNKPDWYSDFYIYGDVHFNREGNEIVFKELKKFFK